MTKIIENFKVSFVEILKIMAGLNFILVLNYFYEFYVCSMHNFQHLSSLTRIFLLISFSYFLGFFFIIVAKLWWRVICVLFVKNKKDKIKERFELFFAIINRETTNLSINRRLLTYEVEEYIEKSDFLKKEIEKEYIGKECRRLFLGALILWLVIFVIFPLYEFKLFFLGLFLFLIVVLTFQEIGAVMSLSERRKKIGEYVSKKMEEEKSERKN